MTYQTKQNTRRNSKQKKSTDYLYCTKTEEGEKVSTEEGEKVSHLQQ